MIQKYAVKVWLGSLLMLLNACVWAPGQHMDTGSFHEKTANLNDFREGVMIQPINGALVAKKISEEDKRKPVLPKVLTSDVSAYHYEIEPQDVLKITVWDHPELTSPSGTFQSNTGNLVYADGSIFYPYVGVMHVAGKTMAQVRKVLMRQLGKFIENPQLSVEVQTFRSQYAYITGQVNKAGQVALTDSPLTVMRIISQAGGVLPTADLRHATLLRDGKIYTLDLFSLYERGQADLNILLKHGDILNIPDNQLNKVFVMGAVGKASTLFIQNDKMSLAESLSDVNGFSGASNPSQVYVIRGKRDKGVIAADRFDALAQLEVYHLDAASPDALILADQFHLQARDVVYVSTTELQRFASVFGDISRVINTTAQTLILKKAAGF
ncbi:MAG: polysaccharide biosynthesis/export family protein [Mariprofundaceae bacterium]|nr:polysaccharide biosynthesis/export family protein [Mariprofundaceae bacterium]